MGKLVLVGTPIGNLEDITLRALKILKEADLIIAEDTRITLKLINHYDLGKKELFSFNEASSERKIDEAINLIKNHNLTALVTDAGMPVVADPGFNLVDKCWKERIEVDIAPGPSAVTTALAVSGFPGSKFLSLGFLPRDKKLRRLLKEIKEINYPIVFFESPNRILKTLKEIYESFGDIDIFIAREITKIYQEFFKGTITEGIYLLENKGEVKGELTVVISTTRRI
ncbi:16S rRNA (cytidine(1402)-2'-O)-methyltransferase [Petrotoga sp. 9PWA.NaAc.5.4]|uniref:16S rRNA (cytidine(1402)-2'-O)-methyltransferase n=1 Tax=Petrotoga sp. 9PWA.NaAc.5.4 TaxID=1434328 RepID=UPI000CCACA4E|nr:16S rRNA (cytidine(1402)-2'-O)-methyltransferase [Petrotoga sp. 9PWA.NaAc.5.4]PNR93642.1 16S rRNA methyltransferase [Petrotoga sp. 9PWA.NaAc.5.4]